MADIGRTGSPALASPCSTKEEFLRGGKAAGLENEPRATPATPAGPNSPRLSHSREGRNDEVQGVRWHRYPSAGRGFRVDTSIGLLISSPFPLTSATAARGLSTSGDFIKPGLGPGQDI
jgi:hypothetical protein